MGSIEVAILAFSPWQLIRMSVLITMNLKIERNMKLDDIRDGRQITQ
jgi:hypothetical protein